MSVYRNNSIDTWPILLVINELPQKIRFRPQNIIIAGLWVGLNKMNNRILLNETFKALRDIETNGIEVNGQILHFYAIYGSFDKPAANLILHTKSFNSQFGCRYCLAERRTINRKCCFLTLGQPRTHLAQIAWASRAESQGTDYKGVKGHSCLR